VNDIEPAELIVACGGDDNRLIQETLAAAEQLAADSAMAGASY